MLFPYVESKQIVLRPATAEHGRRLYEILLAVGRTALPTLDVFIETQLQGVVARFLVMRQGSEEVIGFTEVRELDAAGHARVAVHLEPEGTADVHGDAVVLTVNFAFSMWRLHKVYLYSHVPDVGSVGFGEDRAALVRYQAVLPDHAYFQGRLWDMHVFAVHRSVWDTEGIGWVEEIV